MKIPTPRVLTLTASGIALALLAGCATPIADTTPEGLIRVPSKRADVVYVEPGASLEGYSKFMLIEPSIAFRKGWQSDQNFDHMLNRVDDKDMENMIKTGKVLLVEEFAKALKKAGYELVDQTGSDVLAIKASIVDLDVFAPDPNGTADIWSTTYSNGSGEATLNLELYDAKTQQLLVRAIDRKTNEYDGWSWRISRSSATNYQDARAAFSDWARMFVKGFEQAKQTPFPDSLPEKE